MNIGEEEEAIELPMPVDPRTIPIEQPVPAPIAVPAPAEPARTAEPAKSEPAKVSYTERNAWAVSGRE